MDNFGGLWDDLEADDVYKEEQQQYTAHINGDISPAERTEARSRWNNARTEAARRSQRKPNTRYLPYGKAISEAERSERANAADNRARAAAARTAGPVMALPPSARASGDGEPRG